jgi:hypothetical protein
MGAILPACKSNQNPEFGIPDDPKAKPLGGLMRGEGKSLSQLRREWKIRERDKSKAMFDRMKDDY